MPEDKLSPENIKQGLATRFIGQNSIYRMTLTSTMDAARQAAFEGAPEGTVVLAEGQTEGRGRLRRVWLSPSGCLTFSIILYPETRFLPFLVMISALAVADAIKAFASVKAEIKWPNDVLVKGKKISGILIETGLQEGSPNVAVIGIGLNVNLNTASCPDIDGIATSLFMETGKKMDRAMVLRKVLARFEHWYEKLKGGENIVAAWRARLVTLGKRVQVAAGNAKYEGIAEDVAADGALLLRQPDGWLLKMPAGDVTLKPG